jgi:hypothetical protein
LNMGMEALYAFEAFPWKPVLRFKFVVSVDTHLAKFNNRDY